VSGGYTDEQLTVFPSLNSVGGYQRWLWDRITGINYRKRTNLQLGARFTETLNPSTFYEIKLNSLFTENRMGATPVPSSIPDSAALGSAAVSWSFILPVASNNSPDGLDYQAGYDVFRSEKTRTISFDGSITSQVTNAHLLNAGMQMNVYRIDVSNVLNLRGQDNIQDYIATPLELALYGQDKMEFEGLIANVGLRWDLWSSGQDSYTNLFTPFLAPDSLGIYHPESAPRAESPIYGRLQPRAGVSFPVTVNTVFHLNYGSFMQRPPFQYVVSTRVTQAYNNPVTLGNPRLKPEITNQYDIGATQGFGAGFTLDVSGYYKDVKDQVEEARFYDIRTGEEVTSYYNRDYADIRGFRVALSKRRGALTGSINYQFGVATGKSATVSNASPLFIQDTTGAVTTDLSGVPIRDITLDFDRTHNLIITLGYQTDEQWGPVIFDGYPFGDLNLSAYSTLRSGRPYTSPSNPKLINGARTPWEYNTDMRLTKRVRDFFGTTATFYIEVFNLFNQQTLNYDYLFRRPTSTDPNLALSYYENYPIDDPDNGARYWWDKGKQGPFAVDQAFLIYNNAPRSFSFGVAIEL
jgi:outer membrane receptor protein involved in Fe transport